LGWHVVGPPGQPGNHAEVVHENHDQDVQPSKNVNRFNTTDANLRRAGDGIDGLYALIGGQRHIPQGRSSNKRCAANRRGDQGVCTVVEFCVVPCGVSDNELLSTPEKRAG
jgi:hypothetical protein